MVKAKLLKSSDFIEEQQCESKSEEWLLQRISKTLTLSTTNPFILTFKAMEYAARGPVIVRALEIEKQLNQGEKKPFEEVIKANLGDAHAMGQKPITFIREVLALVACPQLLEVTTFKDDVKNKARAILQACRGGSAGSYSDSRGLELIRNHVAQFIQKRDNGIPANPNDVVLCAGASEGIRACVKLFKSNESTTNTKRTGIMTPCPEYPLYSATLGEYDMQKISYFLDESQNWRVNVTELYQIIDSARDVCNPRAIVIINPGNPTGHVLSRKNIEDIIRFAYKERLFILADEVYQDNVYGNMEFVSFKRVLMEMESPYNQVELASFYSCSKGYACECGLRGAYFEVVNMDSEVKSILFASVAAKLCPTVLGQATLDCVVDPPRPGEPSFNLYNQEKSEILVKFAERAELVSKRLQAVSGIECFNIEGAMYAFPKVLLPEKAILAAKYIGQEPDVFYALELLEATGICVVPGSGIGQIPGTYHFRTTILAPTETIKIMMDKFQEFHINFLQKYS